MLYFNRFGLLTGGPIICSTLMECRKVFVDTIPTMERAKHFDAYLNYSTQLKMLCGKVELKQWINGSFVTKKARPGDIDLVTFIDYGILTSVSDEINKFIYPQSEAIFKVDAYIVSVYPQESDNFFLYESDRAYWIDQFGKTRRNRSGRKLEKGFLEIVY